MAQRNFNCAEFFKTSLKEENIAKATLEEELKKKDSLEKERILNAQKAVQQEQEIEEVKRGIEKKKKMLNELRQRLQMEKA